MPSLVLPIRAKPRSPSASLVQDANGQWVARLKSSPVDGKANAELVALVAQHFGCAKSAVTVISGATARLKLVKVSGLSSAPPPSQIQCPPSK